MAPTVSTPNQAVAATAPLQPETRQLASDKPSRAVPARRQPTLAFTASVPTGSYVSYLDGGPAQPHYIELIPATPGMDAAFTAFWRAAVDWDGKDPIRPFA